MPAFGGPGALRPRDEARGVRHHREAPSDASSILSGQIPDPLWPSAFGKSEPVKGGQNQPFWSPSTFPGCKGGRLHDHAHGHGGRHGAGYPSQAPRFDSHCRTRDRIRLELEPELRGAGRGSASLDACKAGRRGSSSTASSRERRAARGPQLHRRIEYDSRDQGTSPRPTTTTSRDSVRSTSMGRAGTGVGYPSFQVMQFVNNLTRGPAISAAWITDRTTSELRGVLTRWSKLLAAIGRGRWSRTTGRTRPITTSRTSRRARPITMWRPRSPR